MVNKKREIVDATIRRIADMGNSFSTAQIAADVGCSQSLVFRYYKTKERLMSECFDAVCHELKLVIQEVEVPRNLTRESVDCYMIEVWDAYCAYLKNNGHIARAYIYFVSTGKRFPHGYRTAETVLKRILGDDYIRLKDVHPDFMFDAEYIVMMANAAATGMFVEWRNDPDTVGKLDRILRYGILGSEGSPCRQSGE